MTRRLAPNLLYVYSTQMQWLALVYIVKSFMIQSNGLSSETSPSVSQALSPGFDAHPRELGLGTWLKQSKCLTMCDIGQCESIDPTAMLMVTWCHSECCVLSGLDFEATGSSVTWQVSVNMTWRNHITITNGKDFKNIKNVKGCRDGRDAKKYANKVGMI